MALSSSIAVSHPLAIPAYACADAVQRTLYVRDLAEVRQLVDAATADYQAATNPREKQ